MTIDLKFYVISRAIQFNMPLLVIQSLCHNAMLATKSFGSFTPDNKGLRIDNDEPTTRHRLTDV